MNRKISSMALTLLMLTLSVPSLAEAGTVTLKNGDALQGNVTRNDETGVTLEHKTLGTLELAAEQVKDVAFEHSDLAYNPANDGLNRWFFPGWDKSVEAGFNGSQGNSDTLSIYAAFNTSYEDLNDRWLIKADLFYAEDNGENTRSEWEAGITKDWLTPGDPLFYFATFKYEHDRFTGWEDRLSAFIGLGYELIDNHKFELTGRIGAGANYEFGEINDLTPEALAGVDATWRVDENQTLSGYMTFFPALDPFFSEWRNITGAAYKVNLARGRGLSLKLGVENEFNSNVAPGTDNNDLKYFGALIYEF